MSKVVNVRTENPNVRAYLYKMVPRELNSNPIFMRVFGKNFARKRIKSELFVVYTNESKDNTKSDGQQNSSEKSVTIRRSGKDGGLLTPRDIENNSEIKEILLHECIHAIMSLTKEICAKLNITSGTGLLQYYISPIDGEEKEIGRGLNEGYTEWLCEKAGHKTLAYPELTNFVRLLEAARGTANIMSLGLGKQCEALNMSPKEIQVILSIADSLYQLNEEIRKYENIAALLWHNRENLGDKEQIKELSNSGGTEIESLRSDISFLRWAKENGKDISDNSIQEYLVEIKIPNCKISKDIAIVNFESIILEKYFLKDLNAIFDSKDKETENIEKIGRIISFLNSGEIGKSSYNYCKDMASVKVIERYNLLKMEYLKQIAKEEAAKYNDGNLPLLDCVRRVMPYIGNNSVIKINFVDTIVENINFNHKGALKEILLAAFSVQEDASILDNIQNSKLYSLSTTNEIGDITISTAVYTNGHLFDRYQTEQIVDKNTNGTICFDYTAKRGEDIEKVISQFETLRAKILEEHPEATIHIANRTIAVDVNGEMSFYRIINDDIVEMKVTKIEKMNCTQGRKEPQKEQSIALANVKANPLSNFVNGIKRKWHKFRSRNETEMPIVYSDEMPGKISLHTNDKCDFSYSMPKNTDIPSQDKLSSRDNYKEQDDFEHDK